MTKEDVNWIPQNVGTHPKICITFSFKVSFSRWCVLTIHRTTGNLTVYGWISLWGSGNNSWHFCYCPQSLGDLELPCTTHKLNANCVKEQSSWSEATMKIWHYLLSPPSPWGHLELDFGVSCFQIFCSVRCVLLPCTWHFTAVQQDITAITIPDKLNFKVIWWISLSR